MTSAARITAVGLAAALAVAAVLGPAAGGLACAAGLLAVFITRIPFTFRLRPAAAGLVLLFGLANIVWVASDVWRVFGAPPVAGAILAGPEGLADVGWALFAIVTAWAVFLRGRPRIETWLDSLLFVAALTPPLWLAILEPASQNSAISPWVVAWSVLALLAMFSGGLYVMSGGIWNAPAIALAAGCIGNVAVGALAHSGDLSAAAGLPQFVPGYILGAFVALHPALADVFRRGGRKTGIPLSARVWMLVPVVALPLATLEWCYVQAEPIPTVVITGSLVTIGTVLALRAVLLAHAGVRDWTVPLTISLLAMIIAAVAVSLTLLSQSARVAQQETNRLATVLPELKQLDGLLLRSVSTRDDQASFSRWDWRRAIDRLQATESVPRRDLDRYAREAGRALETAADGDIARARRMVDASAREAQTTLVNDTIQALADRQAVADARARSVRLFTVAALMATLLLVATLLLRFNSARRRMELQHQKTHDELTGLPNRVALNRRIRESRPPAADGSRTLVLLDLDDFKAINDSLGHRAGDQVIETIATRLEASLRSDQMLVRVDGDAFALLAAPGQDARAVAERMLAAFQEPVALSSGPYSVRGSIGIAEVEEDDDDRHQAVFRNAELAMYQAKRVNGNSIQTYVSDMHERARDRVQVAIELREALDTDGLHLVYQPIVDLGDGHVVGYEALLRWIHPTRGFISPAEFVPIAEQSGLVVDIGAWVLRTATKQLATWQRMWDDDRYVSVNVAASQLTTRVLGEQVRCALETSGLDPARLLLEVTESSLMDEVEVSVAEMERVRGLGVRFALDDFGTGYSSLSYLRRFPVDVLKVDKAFIDALHETDGNLLVRAIVNMATSLRLQVVAEGIEDPEQAGILQEFGCDLGQGYHFARPLQAADVPENPRRYALPRASSLRLLR